ncbi:hypothetical protein BTUL_0086g00160 [Botrytis tulipae]|uniref:Heterokaryon incompatibility domain-containing protein n=1 Tax=Botrytis tulipae TaxID=87230 RepID=A0A4Z1ETQ3_9HELO|nr:hypothetical protein BTUL_0086g00160 [Botrytis tulipae]
MSSAEKRSGVDGGDGEIADMRELELGLGAMEFDAMERLSADGIGTDGVEVGGVCEAQERGNSEVLVEVDGKDTNRNAENDDGSNDRPKTNDSSHAPDQDSGFKSDTDGLREEASRGNNGYENTETDVSDDSDGYNVDNESDADVDEHDDVPLVEHEEREQDISDESDWNFSEYSGLLSRFEMKVLRYIRWPIEYPQVAEEIRIESENVTNTTTAEVLNPNLCKFCGVFFDTWSSVCDFFLEDSDCVLVSAHFDSISDFKVSASGGCHFCALFLDILHIFQENSDFDAHEAGNHLSLDQLKPHRIKLQPIGEILRGDKTMWSISLDFWMIEDPIRSRESAYAIMILDDILDSEIWKRESYINTKLGQNSLDVFRLGCTEESAALAQVWLQECSSSHSACRQEEEVSVLPTRLIKIDCQEIRLCISADENCSRYATLSHCWGEAEVLRLQKNNVQAFLKKIPFDKLCKTFRDAIDIARVLGFSWLWIDSLCIIQGDSEDWSKEASRMATVYGLSSLNIAATAAPDGTIGCLFERDLRKTGARKIEVNLNNQKKVCSAVQWRFYADNISGAALTNRAWAVQERVLAPRTLHFTESQLFWECRTNQACETFPDTLPRVLCNDSLYLPKQESQSWSDIIRVYSNCSLTYDSDCLIAIGGVARQLQNKNGDKYFAGLWQSRIREQMCWYIDGFITKTPKENTWRAPSWSWASVKHVVAMHDDTVVLREAYIDIVEVDITLEHDDPFGGVKRGVLSIRSKSMLSCEMKSPLNQYGERSRNKITIDRITIGKISIETYLIGWDYEDCGSEGFCNPILVLPIGTLGYDGPNSSAKIEGLLLRPTDQENGQYERLGRLEIWEEDPNYELIRRAMNLAQDEQFKELGLGDALPSEKDYVSTDVDEDGITWYTISIV